jgi:PPP family 3-phenylpropionic acid transporter
MAPVLRQPVVRWFLVSVFLHVLSHMPLYLYLSLYLDDLGYSKTFIGVAWALSVLIEIGWFFGQGRWFGRYRPATWLTLAAAVAVVRMGLIAGGAAWWWLLLLAQLLHAVTFAAHHTACIALLTEHFPGSLRSRGQGLYAVIGYGVPGVLMGLGGGWLSQQLDLSAVFWVATASAALAVWSSSHLRGHWKVH